MPSTTVFLKIDRRLRRRPRRRAHGPRVGHPAPKRQPAPRHPPLAGLSILVVEDHLDSREILEQLLRGDGALVALAEHGQQALDILDRARPDVVLLDLLMPVMDGFALITRLRQDARWARLPVVAVTALGGAFDYRRTFEYGFDAHVTKPIRYDELLVLIRRLTSRRRSAGTARRTRPSRRRPGDAPETR